MSALAPTLQAFFTDRLMAQRQASPNTIAGYRDVFRLLLSYAADQAHIKPCDLDIADLDAPLIGAFLNHLEVDRGNSVRTRNHRLAAIHSLFAYLALHHPEHAATVQRVLAIPPKRFERTLVTFLTEEEAEALLGACDRTRWTGRRDHTMLLLALQTGLRISELNRLTCSDITVGAGANVHCIGKGRKERRTPLVPTTIKVLRVWLNERDGNPSDPLFPTTTGKPLSRDAIERRITLHTTRAADNCPSIATKHVTAHTLRHSCAMRLLTSGSTLRSSLSGWVTSRSRRPTSTSTPTCPRRNAPSPAPPSPTPSPAATRPPTLSWPLSRPCDYADMLVPFTPVDQRLRVKVGITRTSA